METKISKIQFRQDSEANWTSNNPILANGEPGYVTDGTNKGKFKIGDGTTTWTNLAFQTNGNSNVAEVTADGTLCGRIRYSGQQEGSWQEIEIPDVSTIFNYNRVIQALYNTETSTQQKILEPDGVSKYLYCYRYFRNNINIAQGETVTIIVPSIVATKLIDSNISVQVGTTQYLLPTDNSSFKAFIYRDGTQIKINITAITALTNCELDATILYIKD